MATEIRRTVQIKCRFENHAKSLLKRTIDEYRRAANHVVDTVWNPESDQPSTLNTNEIHEQTYGPVRSQTDLHSSHVQLARDRAIEAMTGVQEQREQGTDTGRPQFSSDFLDYHDRCITYGTDSATLATVDGRVHADFVLPEDNDTPHHQYFLNPEYSPARSTLVPKQDRYYLHTVLKKPAEHKNREDGTILGIDLGISNIAVSSTGRFWSGDRITHWRNEYQENQRRLQERGTRWAHQTLKSVSRRTHDKVQQYLHTVSNEIVEEAAEHDCSIIAFEDLSGIHSKVQEWPNMRSWAYRTLIQYTEYKAETEGITVTQVDPENTSKRCSTCGHTDLKNRTSQTRFHCRNCDYENHADYNAAKNIGLTSLRRSQNGSSGGAPAGVRTNSGIITQNGYKPL